MPKKTVNLKVAQELGLNAEEYKKIEKYLGRLPNFTELSIFSVMWSEHASYKNSIVHLKTLPRKGAQIMVEAGEENAGMVDIGQGRACVFKIESHNHPSAVEPFQGAATGVGGINRDIFTMGARPIAQLNSLRFGNPESEHTKWLLKGIVKGISHYGNSFGVPVLGGEVFFDESYESNPLVNAMSVGIIEKGNKTISAIAKGAGNPVYIVGSSTGKDGIHGATFASADLHEDSADDIPSVQVGDPFQEKLLLEASLEAIATDAMVGMQDMGAAGIICSTSEMSEKGQSGMRIDLDKVPLRQKNMEGWEILLSESQERMLIVCKKGHEKELEAVFDKWDLNCAIIGEVINQDKLEFTQNGKIIAEVPAAALVLGGGAPVYKRKSQEPAYFKENQKFNISQISEPKNMKEVALQLTKSANIASKNWVTEQYDTMVRTNNMNTNSPADAGIINLKNSETALAVTTDCNSRYVYADPKQGAAIAVAEAARNITCSGGEPLAITNCLNFGNPYNPEAFWQFENAVKGMGEACLQFNTPVTGGNVSFYNQTSIHGVKGPVYPTPTIGMLGILENKNNKMSLDFKNSNDIIYLLGESKNDINQSEYLVKIHGVKESPAPYFELLEEYKMHQALKNLIKNKLIVSAHDCADGGLFITILESAMPNNFGFTINYDTTIRKDAFLFGEAQGRVVVSVKPIHAAEFETQMEESKTAFSRLGIVTNQELKVGNETFGTIHEFKTAFDSSLEKIIEGKTNS